MSNVMRTLGVVLAVLVAWFICSTVAENFHLVRSLDIHRSIPLYVTATLMGVMTLLFRGHIWFSMLNSAGAKDIAWSKVNYIFSYTRLARYIPGKVAILGIRIWYGKKYGLNLPTSSTVGIMDTLLPVGATLLVSSVFFFGFLLQIEVISFYNFILIMSLVGLVSVMSVVYVSPRIIAWILARRGIEVVPVFLLSNLGKYFALLVIFFTLRGISFALILDIFTSLNLEIFLLGGFLFIGATLLSILSPFTPAGLGITEVTMIAGLQIIFPLETALLLTAVTRMWDIIVDIIFVAISYLIKLVTYG